VSDLLPPCGNTYTHNSIKEILPI